MRRNKEAAEKNKARAAELEVENKKLERSIETTNNQLGNFRSTVTDEQQRLDEVSKNISEAKRAAVETKELASNALAEVKAILLQLSSTNAYDANSFGELRDRLTDLENQFRASQAKKRTSELQQDTIRKKQAIEDQEKQIEKIKRDLENIADISNTLPKGCFKKQILEPR